MAAYPGGVYSPRTKENKAGVVYDASKKTVGFVEDITKLDDEVVAIETELGTDPSGIYATVKAWLTALTAAIVTVFTGLTDTPANYTGQAGKAVLVKATEDGLEFGEAGAAVGGKYGINVEVLAGDKTLTPDTDEIYQYLDEGGANRTITLDTGSAAAGDRFVIRHNGGFTDAHYFLIKQAAATIDVMFVGAIHKFIFNGTDWVPFSVGTGESDDKKLNIVMGHDARAYTYGVAIGYQAWGYSRGVTIGYTARGYTYGVAIGHAAIGYNYGVGIGYNAQGKDYAVAIGYHTRTGGWRYSIALGYYSRCTRVGELAINIGADTDQENKIVVAGWAGDTNDANEIEIYCAGYGTSRFTIRASSVLNFEILITARDNVSGDCAAYKVTGAIKRDAANNTAALAAFVKTIIHEDDAAWDVSVEVDDVNEALVIKVTGDGANPVQWAARLDGVETHF